MGIELALISSVDSVFVNFNPYLNAHPLGPLLRR